MDPGVNDRGRIPQRAIKCGRLGEVGSVELEGVLPDCRTGNRARAVRCACTCANGVDACGVRRHSGRRHVEFSDRRQARRGARYQSQISYLQSEDIASQAIVAGQADIGVGTPYALIQKVNAPIRTFYQLSKLRSFKKEEIQCR